MQLFQPVEEAYVSRSGLVGASQMIGRCHKGLDREAEELSFRGSAQGPRQPRVQKSNYCLQHIIRRIAIASVDPEDPPIETQHDGLISVGEHSVDISKTKCP